MIKSRTERENAILLASMAYQDQFFDEAAGLLRSAWNSREGHDVRGSSHYAAGLLARDTPGDLERACRVMDAVLDQQLHVPGEIFHGTFKRTPLDPAPPVGNYPWQRLSPEARHFGDVYLERTVNAFLQGLLDDGGERDQVLELEHRLEAALRSHFPVVWQTYDPNWREFIGTAFAVALELGGDRLPGPLVRRIDSALLETVRASIQRWEAGLYPMNTNVELMHLFICDYFGHRWGDAQIADQAARGAADLYRRYSEFGTFAEFNSPTYYGVDLCALGLWRRFGRSVAVRTLGGLLEEGLWRNIADFYSPTFRRISGPFSRNYEMDMSVRSMLGACLYIGLGGGEVPEQNAESTHNPLIAIGGVEIPEDLRPRLLEHREDRLVTARFRELIERGDPACNTPLCTATAWIEECLMIGGLRGSRNVSGQLHPATVFWKQGEGVGTIRLLRREEGNPFGKGNRSVFYNAEASRGRLRIEVELEIQREMELYFEIEAEGLTPEAITPGRWNLPGLTVELETDADRPVVQQTLQGLLVVYPSSCRPDRKRQVSFDLRIRLE